MADPSKESEDKSKESENKSKESEDKSEESGDKSKEEVKTEDSTKEDEHSTSNGEPSKPMTKEEIKDYWRDVMADCSTVAGSVMKFPEAANSCIVADKKSIDILTKIVPRRPYVFCSCGNFEEEFKRQQRKEAWEDEDNKSERSKAEDTSSIKNKQ